MDNLITPISGLEAVTNDVPKEAETHADKVATNRSRRNERNRWMRRSAFDRNRPVFVRVPFMAGGRLWTRGKEFPWLTMSMKEYRVAALYNQGKLMHSDILEETLEVQVGDGLEKLGSDGLRAVVDSINAQVKAKTKNKTEYERKKCKLSRNDDKQRTLIRRWRSIFGELETQE